MIYHSPKHSCTTINTPLDIKNESYILGISELNHKHVYVKYSENNIVIANNDYEKQLFLKTLFKIPIQHNIHNFFKENNIEIISPTINNTQNKNIFITPLVIVKTKSLKIQIINVDYCTGIEEKILEKIKPNIPMIIMTNSNQLMSAQSPIYKIYKQTCNTIVFCPTRKTLETFDIKPKEKIFTHNTSNTHILFLQNNKYFSLQLAQIT